jgi:putative hemolysin
MSPTTTQSVPRDTSGVAPVEGEGGRYGLALARDDAEVRAVQRLRFAVFNLELGEGLAESVASGLDADEFDPICDHLVVREQETGEVVGTYRLQSGTTAKRHLGYYSAREFDFAPYEAHRTEILELGRACVAKAHRNPSGHQPALEGHRRVCPPAPAPLPGRVQLAHVAGSGGRDGLCLPIWRRHTSRPRRGGPVPLPGWRCRAVEPARAAPVPRLMAAYLALGARVCAEPALDPEFKTIDFLTWLDLNALAPAVRRKFLSDAPLRRTEP